MVYLAICALEIFLHVNPYMFYWTVFTSATSCYCVSWYEAPPPQSWIEKDLMNRICYRKYIFVVIVPHNLFLLDLSEVNDVGDTYLVKP